MVLNIAEDHLDWHGSLADYAAAKARALDGRVAVVGLDDPVAAALLADAPAAGQGRLPARRTGRRGTRRARRHAGRPGLRGDARTSWLWRRSRRSRWPARSACSTRWPRPRWPARSAYRPRRSPQALASFQVGRHRAEVVAVVDGVTYVDDSKATNPHAAEASVLAYPRVVWVAGGLLKGASVDEMVRPGRRPAGRARC